MSTPAEPPVTGSTPGPGPSEETEEHYLVRAFRLQQGLGESLVPDTFVAESESDREFLREKFAQKELPPVDRGLEGVSQDASGSEDEKARLGKLREQYFGEYG